MAAHARDGFCQMYGTSVAACRRSVKTPSSEGRSNTRVLAYGLFIRLPLSSYFGFPFWTSGGTVILPLFKSIFSRSVRQASCTRPPVTNMMANNNR